jgi:hypothetical protein
LERNGHLVKLEEINNNRVKVRCLKCNKEYTMSIATFHRKGTIDNQRQCVTCWRAQYRKRKKTIT